ncbi:hypothetical protein AKJ41_00605 [candidate division MSBL1 archaeon SCGC-AAA259O05]|uniref:Uncharacterized protein n=1 Tax=candidate division MSBL1 archaeon SCGC-AAA259O05 TaxID=1698271 RepID=A0A133V5H1_9EURY|nr:hypothetical protein AKJ41_00605 [candidate division MSBL1 archaeon SCGC-AAA259O05]
MGKFSFEKYVPKCECPECGRNRLGSSDVNLVDGKGGKEKTLAFRCHYCGSLYISVFREGVSEENVEAAENPADLLNLVRVNEEEGAVHI